MDKEAIRDELNKVREEIKTLKKDFLKHKDSKESSFSQGEDYSNEIDLILQDIKKIEEENNLDKINQDLEEKKKII